MVSITLSGRAHAMGRMARGGDVIPIYSEILLKKMVSVDVNVNTV